MSTLNLISQNSFEKVLEESLIPLFGQETPRPLQDSIRYSLLSGGKRIRPRLLLHCAEMLDLPVTQVLPAAVSLEMIHCFTLIHDDLPCMDDDDFRRGLPSNHKKFGEATALLAGDALLTLAFENFLDLPFEFSAVKRALKRLCWATGPRGVMGGQAAESLIHSNSSLEELHQMHQQKTGALFSAALLIPKDLAGISDDSAPGQIIHSFAAALGLAFQAADDLEDLSESPEAPSEPTSIVHYLEPKQACELALKTLGQATLDLQNHWRDQSKNLVEISNEVSLKFQHALQKLTD